MFNSWYQDPQWWVIIVTLIVAITSFFREKILNYFFKAKVDVEFKVLPPNCHKTHFNSGPNTPKTACYYYRLKVKSLNNTSPKKLEMIVTKKWIKTGDDFNEDKSFLPMSLVWSHYRTSILDHIPPKLFKFCDFGYIIDPQYTKELTKQYINTVNNGTVVLDMDFEIRPNTGSSIIIPGVYRFEIIMVGQNFKEIKKIFEVNVPDYWSNSEQQMLNNGLSTKEIK